jgi:hypothetical protein
MLEMLPVRNRLTNMIRISTVMLESKTDVKVAFLCHFRHCIHCNMPRKTSIDLLLIPICKLSLSHDVTSEMIRLAVVSRTHVGASGQ